MNYHNNSSNYDNNSHDQLTFIDDGRLVESPATKSLYQRVLVWVAAQFGVAAVGIFLIGPLVPSSAITPLYLVTLVAMIVASFSRKMYKIAPFFAIAIPLILGIVLSGTLNLFVATGQGGIVAMAAAGTALIFTVMAIWASKSTKNIDSWVNKMFVGLLILIALSVLNMLLFKLSVLSFVISLVVVVLFSGYIFYDIQQVKRNNDNPDAPAALFALNIFLDIYNIFVSLLNIMSFLKD